MYDIVQIEMLMVILHRFPTEESGKVNVSDRRLHAAETNYNYIVYDIFKVIILHGVLFFWGGDFHIKYVYTSLVSLYRICNTLYAK